MESGPSKIAEALVYWLLPPTCREEVLGDMRERNHNSAQFLVEATSTVPSVVYSRIIRTSDAGVTLFMAVSMYAAFAVSAWWLDSGLLFHENDFARIAIPPAIFLTAIILSDAYSDPEKRWPLKPLFAPTLGFALSSAVDLSSQWAPPASVLAWGGAVNLLLASSLRLTFLPVTDRRQTPKIPALWQKLELSIPSFSLKSALLSCTVLLAIILYLLMGHR